MQRLFEFIGHHPYLAGGAVLAAAVVAFYEIRERIQAFAALSATQAVRLMNQGALVIDLRGKESYDAGHIGDARNVPAADLASQAESLKKWRDKNVITYCDSGVNGASGARTRVRGRSPGGSGGASRTRDASHQRTSFPASRDGL